MVTFVLAYVVAWLGILLYIVRLAVRQRRIQRSITALQAELEMSDGSQTKMF